MVFAETWMQLDSVMSEVGWKEKDRYDITYIWNLKCDSGESTCEAETDSQTWGADWWLPRGTGGGGKERELGTGRCEPSCMKQMGSWVLLHSTENYVWYSVREHNGKVYKKLHTIYMYKLNHFALQQ